MEWAREFEGDGDMSEDVAAVFGIARALAGEIMWENDDGGRHHETPRERWERMRRWAIARLDGDL